MLTLSMSILQRPVTDLKGVGQQLATRLANLQIKTLQDVLFHLPNKYIDRTRIHPIASLRVDDIVVVEGIVQSIAVIPKPKRSLLVTIADGSGKISMRFFYFNMRQQEQLRRGVQVRCFGQVRSSRIGFTLIHPEYRILDANTIVPVEEYLTAIYPACDGVSQNLLRNLVQQTLSLMQKIGTTLELLPEQIRQQLNYIPLMDALKILHQPTPDTDVVAIAKRLAFEELLAHNLVLRQKRLNAIKETAYSINASGNALESLQGILPFKLTNAQLKTIGEVNVDLTRSYPMMRLVQGDVGSGKTLVAVAAALQVIGAGYQVALMAPTEILTGQHYTNIKNWCDKLDIKVCILTGKLKNSEKNVIKQDIENGTVKFIIGTHALLQDTVSFAKLALVIIDEQHRFGVGHRLTLHNKGVKPHQLTLTATPIPRTLAMTFYADLDYSVIDELPPGRKPINTIMISADRKAEILERIKKLCATGQQVYWVCTLIEESEVLECTPAEQAWQDLQTCLPDLNIGLIHSRIKSPEKDQIMQDFKLGNINLLVATTVIEVGVDVPNASLMVIENPERLGLAQLHQLRGRVGRGNEQSYCVLLYKKPMTPRAAQRLQFIRDCQDGFALAEFDLQLRGPGEVFGTKQSGLAQLRIADLVRDKDLLPKVVATALVIEEKYEQVTPQLIKRWIRDQVQYAAV